MRISGITYVKTRKKRGRGFLKFLFTLVLIAVVATATVTAYIAWVTTHPSKQKVTLKPESPPSREVKFNDSTDTLTLDGSFFDGPGTGKTVILVHGPGNNRFQFGQRTLDIIRRFNEEGFAVLAFDLRNSGNSEGKMSAYGYREKHDVLGAIQYVKSQNADKIILVGYSTGAAACLLAASESRDVTAVIADTPYLKLENYISYVISSVWSWLPDVPFNFTVPLAVDLFTGIEPGSDDPQNAIAMIKQVPIMFIHSRNDTVIPFDDSLKLHNSYTARGNQSTLWETNAPGHAESFISAPEAYIDKLVEFTKANTSVSHQ